MQRTLVLAAREGARGLVGLPHHLVGHRVDEGVQPRLPVAQPPYRLRADIARGKAAGAVAIRQSGDREKGKGVGPGAHSG